MKTEDCFMTVEWDKFATVAEYTDQTYEDIQIGDVFGLEVVGVQLNPRTHKPRINFKLKLLNPPKFRDLKLQYLVGVIQKIPAIKEVRQRTRCSLIEAKNEVDTWKR